MRRTHHSDGVSWNRPRQDALIRENAFLSDLSAAWANPLVACSPPSLARSQRLRRWRRMGGDGAKARADVFSVLRTIIEYREN